MSDFVLNCQEVERAIPWMLDDELDADYERDVETHLSGCDACRGLLISEGRFRSRLRDAADRVVAPARLRRRLQETFAVERGRESKFGRYWPAAAAAAVLMVFVGRGVFAPDGQEFDELASRHVRDLPMDVVGSDAIQVQSYLSGKLPFPVRLPRGLSKGRRLDDLGGRVTQFNNRDAAYVRYRTPEGRISVFVYEDAGHAPAETEPLYQVGNRRVRLGRARGFPVAQWRTGGLVYSVLGDMPEAKFQSLVLVADD